MCYQCLDCDEWQTCGASFCRQEDEECVGGVRGVCVDCADSNLCYENDSETGDTA